MIVQIDRLVLKGIRHEDGHSIAAGLQRELERVFADREAVSLLTAVGDVSRLRLPGPLHLERGSEPQRVGEGVAQGIGKETRR